MVRARSTAGWQGNAPRFEHAEDFPMFLFLVRGNIHGRLPKGPVGMQREGNEGVYRNKWSKVENDENKLGNKNTIIFISIHTS